jgi:phosphatidylserine/phosphatidylglycerophosphate/cardiolipin synthase-like enzyme
MTKSQPKPPSRGRLTLGGIVGTVLILIILIAQLVMEESGDGEPQATATPTLVPVPTIAPDADFGSVERIPGGYDGGWFQLYFTEPINSQDEADYHGSPLEDALVAALDGAQISIDAALFELNSEPVTQALVRARERGVTVRFVTDGEYGIEKPETTVDQLELAGITVVSDKTRTGLMHNKFFVIDDLYVWTGSTNITHNGIYNNNNNSMLIRSRQLAENYAVEFEEMFGGSFGKTSPAFIPHPDFTLDNTRIETYFESEATVENRLAELLTNAKTVHFMTFSFTDSLRWKEGETERSILMLLHDRSVAGEIELYGIVESSQRQYLASLFCDNLNVRQDGNPDVFHHKVFIFDRSIVVMGSFNYSNSAANDNDENLLIIHNPVIAQAYLEEFNRRWAESKPVPPGTLGC